MRRLPVALTLLCVLALLSAGGLLWQKAQTEALIREMDEMTAAFDREHPEALRDDAENLIVSFREKTAMFPLFLRHSGLSDVEAELCTLPALLEKGEPRDVPAVLLRCRQKLRSLYELELPSAGNIF